MAKTTYSREELERQLSESRREFWAADATINNLELRLAEMAAQLANAENKCAALAAESAGLKKFCKDAAFDADYEAELGMERGGFSDALNEIKTPATDSFLAEVRAQGVEMAMEHMQSSGSLTFGDCYISLNEFAAKLRQEAAK